MFGLLLHPLPRRRVLCGYGDPVMHKTNLVLGRMSCQKSNPLDIKALEVQVQSIERLQSLPRDNLVETQLQEAEKLKEAFIREPYRANGWPTIWTAIKMAFTAPGDSQGQKPEIALSL